MTMQLEIKLNFRSKYQVDSPTGVSPEIGYKHPNFTCLMLSSSSASLPPTLVLLLKFSITMNNDIRNPC